MEHLYVILKKDAGTTALESFNLLKKSAEERSISIQVIYTEDFDFTEDITLSKQDALYRISTDKQSSTIEKFLINDEVSSFYCSARDCLVGADHIMILRYNNLPINKTIFGLTSNKALLKKYADTLGGFPIIVKALGGSHGVGVMKIESLESLYSVADYLVHQHGRFILRQYIDYKEHARLIVLGNKVISSVEYKRVEHDFRSNAGNDLTVQHKTFDASIEHIAIQAVHALGYEFGGVDILIDQHDTPYIAEVNFPCYFPRAQQYSNIDISGHMIDFLIQKSKRGIGTT